MIEQWAPVIGFEGLYEVSTFGRVHAVDKMQRYLLRTGVEAFRFVPGHKLSQQRNNSGYFVVCLCKNNKRHMRTVHRLVATAFLSWNGEPEVNHKDGVKQNCTVENLEWSSRSANKLHAIALGLYPTRRVRDPQTGREWPSIAQAAKGAHRSHRTIRRLFEVGA
jgi:hypothetical protein